MSIGEHVVPHTFANKIRFGEGMLMIFSGLFKLFRHDKLGAETVCSLLLRICGPVEAGCRFSRPSEKIYEYEVEPKNPWLPCIVKGEPDWGG